MTPANLQSAHGATDAISILIEDHKNLKKLFTEFGELTRSDDNNEEKGALVRKICEELTVHTEIEEAIFYPALRAAIDEDDLMDEADVEHAGARELIAQLEETEPGDSHYDAKVTVLGENIDHHVQEEQDEMFPRARNARLDLDALGAEMLERRQELQASQGLGATVEQARAA